MMKECQYCHKEIPKSSRKCPECGKYCYKMYYADSPFKKRNKEIVRLLEAGNYTLNSVGEMFGISRERARQIYRKVRKKPYTVNLATIRRIKEKQKEREREQQLNTVHFLCGLCKKPVIYRETSNTKRRLCDTCKSDRKKTRRSINTINTCKNCGNEFHPYSNNKNMKFCANPCYFAYKRKYPREFRSGGRPRVREIIEKSPMVIFRINGKIIQ